MGTAFHSFERKQKSNWSVKLVSDPKMTVVHLSVRSAEVEETPVAAAPVEGAEGAAAAAPAEGEAAKEDKK